ATTEIHTLSLHDALPISFIIVDAFDVEGSTTDGGGSTTRVEETSPSVGYTGTWIFPSDPRLSGGTGAESKEANATTTLAFNGTRSEEPRLNSSHDQISYA